VATARLGHRGSLAACVVVLTLCIGARHAIAQPAAPAASYIGTSQCASCHAKEHDASRGSHHDRAMEEASEASMLGNFANATFTLAGVTTRFFRRDGRYFVHTDGPGGKLAEFEVKYTFGVYPLQQYLVELPGGRLQAIAVTWDARPREQGGQRWFRQYPNEQIDHADELHWTRRSQN
jgi:hypothetical protein